MNFLFSCFVLGRVFVKKIISHLSIKNVATNIERDGLLLRFLLLRISIDVSTTTTTTSTTRRKRNVTEETTTNFNDRSRKERAKREAISPPSLRARSRVFLHIRDAWELPRFRENVWNGENRLEYVSHSLRDGENVLVLSKRVLSEFHSRRCL